MTRIKQSVGELINLLDSYTLV